MRPPHWAIAAEAVLSLYVIRMSLAAEELSTEDAVRCDKALSQVARPSISRRI